GLPTTMDKTAGVAPKTSKAVSSEPIAPRTLLAGVLAPPSATIGRPNRQGVRDGVVLHHGLFQRDLACAGRIGNRERDARRTLLGQRLRGAGHREGERERGWPAG